MIAATALSTSSSTSRRASTSARNAASNPAVRASSLSAIDRLPEALDPAPDLLRPGLQRGAVDNEARADIGNVLDHDQSVRLQSAAGLHQIDDAAGEAERRRELHRARQLDAFGLHAARGEMAAGDLR